MKVKQRPLANQIADPDHAAVAAAWGDDLPAFEPEFAPIYRLLPHRRKELAGFELLATAGGLRYGTIQERLASVQTAFERWLLKVHADTLHDLFARMRSIGATLSERHLIFSINLSKLVIEPHRFDTLWRRFDVIQRFICFELHESLTKQDVAAIRRWYASLGEPAPRLALDDVMPIGAPSYDLDVGLALAKDPGVHHVKVDWKRATGWSQDSIKDLLDRLEQIMALFRNAEIVVEGATPSDVVALQRALVDDPKRNPGGRTIMVQVHGDDLPVGDPLNIHLERRSGGYGYYLRRIG